MEIIINDNDLSIKQVNEINNKVRAILIDDNDNILVANYGGVMLLPGGSIEEGEELLEAIKRELKEETGLEYNDEELSLFLTLNYFQKNYPKRNNTFSNRLVNTHYFIGEYKDIVLNKQNLTEEEQKCNFKLELVALNELENKLLSNTSNNPRNIYFQKELLAVLNCYKETIGNISFKKKVKKCHL